MGRGFLTYGFQPALFGDDAVYATYWPGGVPTDDWYPGDKRQDISHLRAWMGNNSHTLTPAPAVTYGKDASLPATITVAISPWRPARTLHRYRRFNAPLLTTA